MTSLSRAQRLVALFLACVCLITRALPSAQAQDQPPSFSPDQLDQIVSRIALYPDPLLAQILTASTFSDQIPDAASWADQHHYLTGQALSNAITADQLPWDPSVQALLPFPSVLDQMASDPNWTNDLGNAVNPLLKMLWHTLGQAGVCTGLAAGHRRTQPMRLPVVTPSRS